MSLQTELYALERKLADGDGDTYREHLTEDAVVIVPSQTLSKDETARAMDDSPGWDRFSLEEERFVRLGEDAALLTYRFRGSRGEEFSYAALMGSVYVRRKGSWKLAFHQQTPIG